MVQELRYYSPDTIAELMQVSKQTVYRRIEEGKFPNARRRGPRAWIVPEQDLIDYLGYDPSEVKITMVK